MSTKGGQTRRNDVCPSSLPSSPATPLRHENRIPVFFFCFGAPSLTVGLGNTLDLVLLLDSIGVGGSTGGVDELLGEALGHGLEVAEGSLTGTGGEEVEGVVDPTEGGHVDSLTTDDTGATDAGGILTGTGVDDGINDDLDGVLVGEEVDDLEGVLDDADGHELLASVAALLHEAAGKTLNDGAGGLAESLLLVATGSVGKEGGVVTSAGDVVL